MIQFSNMEMAGLLPSFFDPNDPRPAREQADEAYSFAGGWQKFEGLTLKRDIFTGRAFLEYPGDPPMWEISNAKLRNEMIILFQGSWVAIIQQDGSYEIARMD